MIKFLEKAMKALRIPLALLALFSWCVVFLWLAVNAFTNGGWHWTLVALGAALRGPVMRDVFVAIADGEA